MYAKASTTEILDNNLDSLDAETIVFVTEAGKEKIHTQGTDFYAAPSGGSEGQFLRFEDDLPTWKY